MELCEGKSRTSQILSDAWESTIWEDVFDNLWQMVITETRLTKKFITDEEGAGLLLPRIGTDKPPEVERIRFYVLSANVEAHGHIGPGYTLFTSPGEEAKPRKK